MIEAEKHANLVSSRFLLKKDQYLEYKKDVMNKLIKKEEEK